MFMLCNNNVSCILILGHLGLKAQCGEDPYGPFQN